MGMIPISSFELSSRLGRRWGILVIHEMAYFFLVNRDFIRSRKPWFCNIILREMRKKYLFFREPWFWLCLLLFSTVANNAAYPWHDIAILQSLFCICHVCFEKFSEECIYKLLKSPEDNANTSSFHCSIIYFPMFRELEGNSKLRVCPWEN